MLERFTDRARRVVVLAQQEARVLNHDYLGTAHILLGLIDEGEGTAARALESLGINLEVVRQQVEEIIGQGQQVHSGHIPFTPRAKKVLELSLREALQLGHDYTGTEHILLGLIREGEDVAAQVLVKLGADLDRVRLQVIQLLHGSQGKEPAGAPAAPPERAKPPAAARVNAIGSRLSSVWQRVGARPGTGGLGQRPSGTVPVALVGVRVEQQSDQPIVVLKEAGGDRYLPIWVGQVEATAIVFAQEGRKRAPPLTHELLWDVLATMGIQLLNVTISTLIDGIFDCHIFFSNHRTVEARPSDAIALAIRAGAPILVDAELLDEAGVSIADDGSLSGFRLRGAGTTRSRARQPERRSHIGMTERRQTPPIIHTTA
jgi:bifunctional DNase/RNase